MATDLDRLEQIFAEAADQADPAARATFLEKACGGDAELRHRVAALLAAHESADSFLKPPSDGPTCPSVPLGVGPQSKIGRYKLLEQIGEGGFGVVFMAEQEEPVRRIVALKIIKPGMDTRQVVARFEAERQALAMMDHPNVAKVLDGGSTEAGRSYFVMELVKGIPITKYCDERHLSIQQRLELFLPVCRAVQHAHQKGVIRREI
jgi:eukaryotic-like serine/threonine-protein kinase